jgi:hypothetical protein
MEEELFQILGRQLKLKWIYAGQNESSIVVKSTADERRGERLLWVKEPEPNARFHNLSPVPLV